MQISPAITTEWCERMEAIKLAGEIASSTVIHWHAN
jgi:hypothetical protein